ncbi:12766_t:CDS:2, partial [Gigaspora margarita]
MRESNRDNVANVYKSENISKLFHEFSFLDVKFQREPETRIRVYLSSHELLCSSEPQTKPDSLEPDSGSHELCS